MTIEEFFTLFISELKDNKTLWPYYKFLQASNQSVYNFRINYFLERLRYIQNQIEKKDSKIWDCGCGYGTTAIFLTLKGFEVYGNTLEFYHEQIGKRLNYWSKFGNLDKLKLDHNDIFETNAVSKYDYVITQDTLHHLEPIDQAIGILSDSLNTGGKLIVIEENGSNYIKRLKYFIQRGNKKIIELHDEKLNKTILLGNENIRPVDTWAKLLSSRNLQIDKDSVEYVRIFPPSMYRFFNSEEVVLKEKHIWERYHLLKKYFFFGVNFTASKKAVKP
jgi:SAM-dependent methyltransferase